MLVRRATRWLYGDVPFVPLDRGEVCLRGETFEEFLESLARGGHVRAPDS